MDYEVIIVGASFAGLAVAAQLLGKHVLLLDRKPIGEGQTSACGTPVSTLRALGLEDAILQIHDRLVVHTPDRSFAYPMVEPFCTFDYRLLCRLLYEQGDARFLQASALGTEGGRVHTSRGSFDGAMIVDASGWRAALGSQLYPDLVRRERLSFGLETTAPCCGDGLHFWYDPRELLPFGITWAFPAGELSRLGVASFRGETHLMGALKRFLGNEGLRHKGLNGGYLPHAMRDPTAGELFLVGDAAGQCLALTGEGIRPALFFGTHLGCLLRQVLDGDISPDEARTSYRRLVALRKLGYDLLCLAQRALPLLPLSLVDVLFAILSRPAVLRRLLARYLAAFCLADAQIAPPRQGTTHPATISKVSA